MKNSIFTVILVMVISLCGGCRTGETGRADNVSDTLQMQTQGREIIRAIAERDFERYRLHGGEASGIAADKEFSNSCDDMEKRLGRIRDVTFVTFLETPGVANLVYRIDFCRKTENGKELKHQQLFQLIFGKVDGSSKLLGMRIM